MSYQRVCQCGKIINYKRASAYKRAIKENRKCHTCATRQASKNLSKESRYKLGSYRRGKHLSVEEKERLRQSKLGKKRPEFSIEWKNNLSLAQKKRFQNENNRKKLSIKMSGGNNPMYGKTHTKEARKIMSKASKSRVLSTQSREKMRKSRIEYMRTHNIYHGISKSETLFLNKIEELYNIKFERSVYVGGRYYDAKIKNCLVEVDGKYWHSKPKMIEVDILKNKIAKNNGYTLYRFEVNNVEEVDEKITKYKPEIEKMIL